MKTETEIKNEKKIDTGARALTTELKAIGFTRSISWTDKRVDGRRYKLLLEHTDDYSQKFTDAEAKVIDEKIKKNLKTDLYSIRGIGTQELTIRAYFFTDAKKRILEEHEQTL